MKYSSFVGLNMYRFVHILHILSENLVGCTGAGAPKAPTDEGGGFAARRRRRERILPLSQPARLTAPLTRGALAPVQRLDKLEFVNLILFDSKQTPHPVLLHYNPALYKKHLFLHSKAVYQV